MARNKQLAKTFHSKPCTVCGKTPSDPDHIKNYAGNPDRDTAFNIWPLCRTHHIEKGAMGLQKFIEKYRLWHEVEKRGFYWDELSGKYRHEKL